MNAKMTAPLKERLIKILIDQKLVTQERLDGAIKIQKEKGGKLSDVLIELGYIDKKDLMIAMSYELGIPAINLSKYKIDPAVVKLIPEKIARQYQIIPISKIGNTLSMAMADPLNVFAIDDIKTMTGLEIEPVVTTDKDIKDAIEAYYGQSAHAAIDKMIEDIEESKRVEMVEETSPADLSDSASLARLVQETPVVKITNMLLAESIALKSSDVLIEPMERKLRIRYRVDGVLQESSKPTPKVLHNTIVSRLKVMAGLDIAEHRLPQDGRFKIKYQNREVDFRISVLPSSMGEKVALRILDKTQAMLDVDKLGFEPQPLQELKKAADKPHGMILVCGPTGCGKTTTLYSVLKYVDTPDVNIITVEDPVEYQLRGINQVTIRPEIGLTFASSLRSILRQDPDIIMVGEIRDFETVDIAIKAALTGHLVLSTLHTTTACGSITRLVNMGVEPFLISSSVILVAAQRLIRKICQNCKEEYEPDKKFIEKLQISDLPKKILFYRGKGCPMCGNTGYKGRIGIIETLTLTPAIRDLISDKAQEHLIKEQARKEGMKTLRENGITKVFAGLTTLEEVLRITIGDQEIAL